MPGKKNPALIVCFLAAVAFAQNQPPLMECGKHGDVDIICGTHSPEDLELTPDGKYLIVSQLASARPGGGEPGLVLLDLSAGSYAKLPISAEPLKDWGDTSCPGPALDKLAPHGISLARRANGMMQLYVVNHGGRQSMEMFELKSSAGAWSLIWHGCAVSEKEFNDVAVLKDGSFIATHPTALRSQGDTTDLFGGAPSGYVARWTAGKGEEELPGTRAGYPNGVLVSADGKYMYFNAWTAREVHKYDLSKQKEAGVVKLDFLPDNITWTSGHRMLAAGVKGARGDCPAGSGKPCIQGFGVAEIDPGKWTARNVLDSQGKEAMISGVSVALEVGKAIYIGAFQGDRLVRASVP
jgi:hypothetical protein